MIDPLQLVAEFGLDPVRYFLMREVPFGKDGDFSRSAFIQRMNSDLANDFGNLAQRCLSMIAKNCDGKVPQPGEILPQDEAILDKFSEVLTGARAHMDVQAIHLMLEARWRQVSDTNKYFAGEEPWALKKTDPARMNTVLYVTAEAVRRLAILAQPIMPGSTGRMLDQLGVAADARDFAYIDRKHELTPGTALPAPEGVFPRFQGD